MTALRSDQIEVGQVVAVDVDGEAFVVWRGASGALCSAPRYCPHLDSDLTIGRVVGDELECYAHGWSFTCDGRVLKRNEAGREDDKGTVNTLTLQEAGGVIEYTR